LTTFGSKSPTNVFDPGESNPNLPWLSDLEIFEQCRKPPEDEEAFVKSEPCRPPKASKRFFFQIPLKGISAHLGGLLVPLQAPSILCDCEL